MSFPGPQQPDPSGQPAWPPGPPEPGAAQPGYGPPDATQPGYTQPEYAQPHYGQPGGWQPGAGQAGGTGDPWASPGQPIGPAGHPTGPAGQSPWPAGQPTGPAGQPPGSDVPPIPQAPTAAPEPQAPLGQSPYGQRAPMEQSEQGSYGQFTFPVMKRRPLEPTAVAAVATSPLGPVGVGLGIFARRQVKATRRRSLTLASTGIGLGALFTVLWVLAAVVLAGNGTIARWTEQPQAGDVSEARTVAASNVAVGNCIQFLPPGQSVGELQLVPCAQEHAAQAVTEHELDGSFPGVDALDSQARETCQADVSALASEVPVMVWYLAPSQQAWDEGTQRILCVARAQSGSMTGDLVNG